MAVLFLVLYWPTPLYLARNSIKTFIPADTATLFLCVGHDQKPTQHGEIHLNTGFSEFVFLTTKAIQHIQGIVGEFLTELKAVN
ncbi:hypothetical protein chiPu_0011058 [Chiloscyllium punctatum]|uniref:Uncharacterized protein n=1 Tax=Chiloscyllium punctatum TaxID=137246 RepID=A0A401SQB7_CHIPU|nr:hypothetical protein [Chiloscyllium punctatum]